MNFKQIVAKYFSGNLSAGQLPKLSYIAFEEGYDSPSLWILAGLNEYDDSFEIEQYLKSSLEELSIPIPSKRKAAIEYAKVLAEEIIAGNRDAAEGVYEITTKAFRGYDFYSETKNNVYDRIFFELVYGTFAEYEDFGDANDWKTDQQTIETFEKFKEELVQELENWIEKVTPYLDTIT